MKTNPALVLCLLVWGSIAMSVGVGDAWAQSTLSPDVREAIGRLDQANRAGGHNAGILSDADRAVLFANNDAINAARINNEIHDAVYQAAQQDFDGLNQTFAGEAAEASGAKFTVQQRSSNRFSPGTDSDYITMVDSKDQIEQMQQGYNDRVNKFLKDSKVDVEPRNNWHNKLDTDFMADPSKIKTAEEFRDIARMNNDAYKSRFAAEYERISRAGDGTKIGPDHVNGYLDEMNDFAGNKANKIDDLLAKGPSYMNDPRNRAKIYQAMAQEQKYVSRLESLDDYLRAQEGLPPRSRGLSSSRLGSNRSPHNAANTRAGHGLADAGRMSALEDIAETMGQVAKKNPRFNPNAADDIARIVEGLPPNRRAGVLARIRANNGAGFVDDILEASVRARRLPQGSASLADDLARAGSKADDAARAAAGALDDVPSGAIRRALGKGATQIMIGLGRLGGAFDAASAAAQLNEYYKAIMKARDLNTSDADADAAFARAQEIANQLIEAGVLGAIIEANPAAALAFGTWILTRHGGQWILENTETGQIINRIAGELADRHVSAWDRAGDWWTGKDKEREEHVRSLCGKFMKAVREQRVSLRGSFTVKDVCDAIGRGDTISDMIAAASVSPEEIEEPSSGLTGPSAVCTPQRVSGTYSAAWGPIKCNPNGAGLRCCYGSGCKWTLQLELSGNGRKLEGNWDHNDGQQGPVEFGLNENCELSSGRYGYKAGQLTSGWSVTGKSRVAQTKPKQCESFCVEWVCGVTGSACAKLGNSCSGDTKRDTRGGNLCGKGCQRTC